MVLVSTLQLGKVPAQYTAGRLPEDLSLCRRRSLPCPRSAHFDSALGVPAASDDLAQIGIMVEVRGLGCFMHAGR